MKLFPLDRDNRLVYNISKHSRKLRIRVLTPKAARLNSIIIIGNGTPDDIAVSIIAYHLDGDSLVGIVKPEKTGLGVIESIPTYLSDLKIDKIVVLIDQDDNTLDSLFDQCQEKLNSFGIQTNIERCEGRLKIYECIRGHRTFTTILVINGLNEISVRKHAIEDHLLKVAMSLNFIEAISEEFENSKDLWRILSQSHKDEVFKRLKESKKIREIFPQQVMACEYLKEPK